jgi:glutathione S-transferase
MIIFGASLSPFVRKVLAFAAEKGVAVENKQVALGGSPEYRLISPFGKIPGLKDGDFTVSDSSAIVTYIEAKHPEPALFPSEARDRARAVWFDEFADTIAFGAASPMFFNRLVAPRFLGQPGDQAAADKAEREALPPVLDYLEGVVPEPGGFLVDGRLTIADLAVASPFANLRHLKLDLSRWPKTKAWSDAILDRPSFAPLVAAETRMLGK